MRRFIHRPSPAFVLASIALFVALGGTTYALTLPVGSVGSAQLKRSAVVNSRIYPGAVSNSKMGRGAVTFSKMASNQMTAAKIRNGSLLGEDLAANTITGAQVDEASLGITKFAFSPGNGTIGAQSGGIAVAQQLGAQTILNFGASMAGRPILATLSGEGAGAAGEIAAAPCGGASSTNPGGVTCPAPYNTPSNVAVTTYDSNGAPAAKAFYVAVPQA